MAYYLRSIVLLSIRFIFILGIVCSTLSCGNKTSKEEYNGNGSQLYQVYYREASKYRDLNDAPQALEYYQKAIEEMPESELRLKSYTYNQMGKLFMLQGIDEKALCYFSKSFQLDSIRKDTLDMIYSLIDMSMAYENTFPNKSLQYLHKARLLDSEADTKLSYKLDSRMSVLFANRGEYDSAYLYIQSPLKNIAKMDSSAVLSVAIDVYMKKHKVDSARHFCLEIMRKGRVHAKQNAAMTLAKINFDENNPTMGFKYLEKYKIYSDSVDNIDAKKYLANANALYNYQLREKENAQLKIENRDNAILGLIVLSVGILAISLLLVFNARNRQRLQRLRFKYYMRNKIGEELKEQSENEIKAMKGKMEALTSKLVETDKSKENLERQLEDQKAKLSAAIENNKKATLREDTQRHDMLRSRSYSIAKARLEEGKPISDRDWKLMEKELGNIFCDFKFVLYEAYDLTELEYRICWLVKMGFKNNEVSILISRAPNAVSLARKRLFSKITGKEGTAYDFDVTIKNL